MLYNILLVYELQIYYEIMLLDSCPLTSSIVLIIHSFNVFPPFASVSQPQTS